MAALRVREARHGDALAVDRHHPRRRRDAFRGMTQGLEYAELPFVLDVLVVVAWLMFTANIVMTVVTRKYQQMYVSIWYIVASLLWTAVVYLVRELRTMFTSGTNQANLKLGSTCTTPVGLIFTALGLGIGYYFIPKAAETPLYSHRLSMVGFWSLPSSTSGRVRITCCTGRSASGCRRSRSSSP